MVKGIKNKCASFSQFFVTSLVVFSLLVSLPLSLFLSVISAPPAKAFSSSFFTLPECTVEFDEVAAIESYATANPAFDPQDSVWYTAQDPDFGPHDIGLWWVDANAPGEYAILDHNETTLENSVGIGSTSSNVNFALLNPTTEEFETTGSTSGSGWGQRPGLTCANMISEKFMDVLQRTTSYDTAYPGDNPDSDEKAAPRITYSIDQFQLRANYEENLDLNDLIEGTENDSNYKIVWTVQEDHGDTVETLFTYATMPDETFKYKFNYQGAYVLTATVLWRGTPYPALSIAEEDIAPIFIVIPVDGSTYAGDTGVDTCAENSEGYVWCEAQSEYEDCSTLFGDFDIVGGFGCVLGNFGTFLRILFFTIFTPNTRWISTQFSKITESFNDNEGISDVIVAPLESIATLTTAGCSTANIPLPFVGSNLQLPCMTTIYNTYLGALFTLYQTIVTGIISYYVILGFLATAKGFKDPQNDRIEAASL